MKADIERELNADEIRRQLHNESVMAELEDAKTQVESAAKNTEQSVNKIVNSASFDPGASKFTDEQVQASNAESEAVQEKSFTEELAGEIEEVGEELQEVKKNVYGSGSNPKLASTAQEEPKSDSSYPIGHEEIWNTQKTFTKKQEDETKEFVVVVVSL